MRNGKNLKLQLTVLGVLIAMLGALLTGTTAYACTEDELLTFINNERISAGLAPLSADKELAEAARVRAKECSEKFSHTRPDGTDYYTVSDAVYGENLAVAEDYNTLEEVVKAWMASPSHRANVLYAKSTKTGFSTYEINGKIYIAEEFN